MVSVMYVMAIAILAPLFLMLFLLDKKSRATFIFFIIGIIVCVFVSEVNALFLQMFNNNIRYVTTTITPLTEEFFKALPLIYFAFLFSSNRSRLLSGAMALGIGFAVFENVYILTSNIHGVTYLVAIVRGFGSGLMHGICTALIGYGLSFVRTRRKLLYTGIFGLYIVAVTYHAIYNTLVQSSYEYVGFAMPIVSYLIIIACLWRINKKADDGEWLSE